jgi:hypothetical protein
MASGIYALDVVVLPLAPLQGGGDVEQTRVQTTVLTWSSYRPE